MKKVFFVICASVLFLASCEKQKDVEVTDAAVVSDVDVVSLAEDVSVAVDATPVETADCSTATDSADAVCAD